MWRVMIAAAIAVMMLASAPALADRPLTPAERAQLKADLADMPCDQADVNAPDTVASNAGMTELAESPNAPPSIRENYSTAKLRADYEAYRKRFYPEFQKGLTGCKNPKRRNRATATYNTATATIQHALDGDWQTTMNLANQQLQRCVIDYYGQTKGAECQTQLEKNIRLKLKWESAARP